MSQLSAKIQIANGTMSYGIDRSMPTILSGRMSENQWRKLCDEVDEELKPLNKFRKFVYIGMIGIILCFVITAVVMILSFNRSFNSDPFSSNGPGSSMLIFLLIPLGMAILIGSMCYASSKARKAFDRVKEICEQTSKIYNGELSFHLRDDRMVVPDYSFSSSDSFRRRGYRTYHNYYILVSIGNDGGVELGGGDAVYAGAQYPAVVQNFNNATAVAVPMANAEAYPTATPVESMQERLEKLESIKHCLSPKEYGEKKKEILSEI